MAWSDWKQEVLLKWFIVLIAVLDGVAACVNSSYIEMCLYFDNCDGQGINTFIIAAYLHVVTNVQIHSVTHKYIAVGHTK